MALAIEPMPTLAPRGAAPLPLPLAVVPPRPPRDRDHPSLWEALAVDPMLPVPDDSRELQIRNLQRWTRRHLRPVLSVVCRVVVAVTLALKRIGPL